MRITILSLLTLLVACGVKQAPVAPSPSPSGPAAPTTDCTFATPLVKGVPGSPGHLIPTPRNPNGASEMAVLMRRFVDDLRAVRVQIESGTPVRKLFDAHRKMRCAWHTDPAERTEAWDRRAQAYLQLVRELDAAPSRAAYNAVVTNCIACHSVSCRGVVGLLQKLSW